MRSFSRAAIALLFGSLAIHGCGDGKSSTDAPLLCALKGNVCTCSEGSIHGSERAQCPAPKGNALCVLSRAVPSDSHPYCQCKPYICSPKPRSEHYGQAGCVCQFVWDDEAAVDNAAAPGTCDATSDHPHCCVHNENDYGRCECRETACEPGETEVSACSPDEDGHPVIESTIHHCQVLTDHCGPDSIADTSVCDEIDLSEGTVPPIDTTFYSGVPHCQSVAQEPNTCACLKGSQGKDSGEACDTQAFDGALCVTNPTALNSTWQTAYTGLCSCVAYGCVVTSTSCVCRRDGSAKVKQCPATFAHYCVSDRTCEGRDSPCARAEDEVDSCDPLVAIPAITSHKTFGDLGAPAYVEDCLEEAGTYPPAVDSSSGGGGTGGSSGNGSPGSGGAHCTPGAASCTDAGYCGPNGDHCACGTSCVHYGPGEYMCGATCQSNADCGAKTNPITGKCYGSCTPGLETSTMFFDGFCN